MDLGESPAIVRLAKWSAGRARTGNMLIHGENLDTLDVLAATRPGSVRCAYLDPPYNNGESYEHYLDSMEHEEWLDALTSRITRIRDLLRDDGSLWISIDDSEVHYLKVSADRVFGRANFVGTIVWERRTTRENRRVLSRNHEYLLVYARDIEKWTPTRNLLPLTDEVQRRHRNADDDPRGPWQSVSANVQDGHGTPQQRYTLEAPSGKLHRPPKGRCWVYTQARMLEEIEKNNIWFGKDGRGVPRIKKFLAGRKAGLTPDTLWRAADVGTTGDAKKHLLALFKTAELFDTPKPELLLKRVIEISSDLGDVVLDPYLGSGTTAAVAHKMGRRYIGIEQGEHILTHCVSRLRQVIDGEPGGASGPLNWRGGGGFDFFRLRGTKRRAK
jgi:adenine-specific DNA-methyltransferase